MNTWLKSALIAVAAGFAFPAAAPASPLVLHYYATWAGLPAAEIHLRLEDDGAAYWSRADIRTEGLPRWLTKFQARAISRGKWTAAGTARPERYDVVYDLRKRKDKRASLRFVEKDGGFIAERGPEDTSSKPPPPEETRRGAVDPLTALAAVRRQLQAGKMRPGASFVIPVFDGSRRFDVEGSIARDEKAAGRLLHARLTLRPIAGFKDETPDADEDADDTPRSVEISFTDDERLLPVSLSVSIAWLPAVVRLDRECTPTQPCRIAAQ